MKPITPCANSRLFAMSVIMMVLFVVLPAMGGSKVPFSADIALLTMPAPTNDGCTTDSIRFNASGTGTATHMGSITVTEFVCMKLDSTFVAHYTFIAANGDQVFGTATGYVVFTSATTFDVHGNWIVDGGTGRFLNATGSGTATGEVDLGTGVAPHHQVGVISSVGSSMGQ